MYGIHFAESKYRLNIFILIISLGSTCLSPAIQQISQFSWFYASPRDLHTVISEAGEPSVKKPGLWSQTAREIHPGSSSKECVSHRRVPLPFPL